MAALKTQPNTSLGLRYDQSRTQEKKWQIRVKTGDMDMTHSVDGILVLLSVRQRQEVLVKLRRFQAISAPYNEVLFWPLAVRHGNCSNY